MPRLLSRSVRLMCLATCLSALGLAAPCGAQAVDNSAQNKTQTATADQQGNAKSDLMTTAQVRRAILRDKALSVYAHNVKILVAAGAVTLKGPVHSEQEKSQVAADAANVVSPDKITNDLTVQP